MKIGPFKLTWQKKAEPARSATGAIGKHHQKIAILRSFAAAKVDNIFPATAGSPQGINEELYRSNSRMRQRAREEANNNEYVARALHLIRRNVIGPSGIMLQPDFVSDQTGQRDERDIDLVSQEWADWCRPANCDVTGRMSLKEMSSLFMETVFRDGECFIRLVRGWRGNRWRFAMQVLDADFFDENDNGTAANGNTLIMGIELDQWNRPVAYNLRKSEKETLHQAYARRHHAERIPAEEMIHSFFSRRAGQVRGYTSFHAAFGRIHQLKGYEEAEVVAARVGAEKMGFIISPDGEGYDGEETAADGIKEMRSEPGGWEQLPEGTTIEKYDPDHPNTALPAFVKSMLRGFSSGIGIGYNDIASDLEGVNYSSLRHGSLVDRAGWRELQAFVIEKFLDPIYRAWLEMSILSGALPFPAARIRKFQRVKWEPRGFEWVDPKKESESDRENYRLGTTSITEVLARRGTNPEKVFRERQAEKKLAEKYGVPLDSGLSQPSSPLDGDQDTE